eukprot:3516563-Rhodomonas_salina.3
MLYALCGTELAYGPTLCGTELAYGTTLCGTELAYGTTLCGTELAYGTTLCGTELAYGPRSINEDQIKLKAEDQVCISRKREIFPGIAKSFPKVQKNSESAKCFPASRKQGHDAVLLVHSVH